MLPRLLSHKKKALKSVHLTPDVEGWEKSETSISGYLMLPLLGRQTMSSGSTSVYEHEARSDESVPVRSSSGGLNSGAGEWHFSVLAVWCLLSLSRCFRDEWCVPFSSSLLPSVYNSSSEIQCSSSSCYKKKGKNGGGNF